MAEIVKAYRTGQIFVFQRRKFLSLKDDLRDSTSIISKTVFERQKSSSLGTAHETFCPSETNSRNLRLKDKIRPCALGLSGSNKNSLLQLQ